MSVDWDQVDGSYMVRDTSRLRETFRGPKATPLQLKKSWHGDAKVKASRV